MTSMTSAARISPCGLFRYSLHRDWRQGYEVPRWVTFVMLNPSTADADQDDPTIRRCVRFARRLGGTGLVVVNLYAFRTTSPADLWRADDPVGPGNDETLERFLGMARRYDFPLIAAWGANAKLGRVEQVMAVPGAERFTALGTTKDGAPRHPLYLPGDTELTRWPVLGRVTGGER